MPYFIIFYIIYQDKHANAQCSESFEYFVRIFTYLVILLFASSTWEHANGPICLLVAILSVYLVYESHLNIFASLYFWI